MAALEMPPYIRSRKFNIFHAQQLSPSGEEGFIQTLNRTQPFWLAEYQTPPLNDTRLQEWTTFLDQLEGAIGTFLAYDPRRVMPLAYRTQPISDAVWGAPFVGSADYTNSTLSLDGFIIGSVISIGDYISFQFDGVWYLFRAQSAHVTTGAAIVVSVKPRPNILGFVNAVDSAPLRYRRACVEMKVIGRIEEQDSVDDLPTYGFRAGHYTARAPT